MGYGHRAAAGREHRAADGFDPPIQGILCTTVSAAYRERQLFRGDKPGRFGVRVVNVMATRSRQTDRKTPA